MRPLGRGHKIVKNTVATADEDSVPLRFPGLLLESLVNGLRYAGLHQVDVADDVRCKHVAQVIVKPAAAQALYSRTRYVTSRVTSRRHDHRVCSSPPYT